MPDPVENVEWKIIKAGTNGHIIDVMACDDEKESGRILNDNAAAYRHYIHTLKSITTIERTLRIVRPAVVALLVLLTGCATPWSRHCQPGCRCDKLDTSEVCSLNANPAYCACRDYSSLRHPKIVRPQ